MGSNPNDAPAWILLVVLCVMRATFYSPLLPMRSQAQS